MQKYEEAIVETDGVERHLLDGISVDIGRRRCGEPDTGNEQADPVAGCLSPAQKHRGHKNTGKRGQA